MRSKFVCKTLCGRQVTLDHIENRPPGGGSIMLGRWRALLLAEKLMKVDWKMKIITGQI